MKIEKIAIYGTALVLVIGMFAGCGGRSGEKEYDKGLRALDNGELVQARALLEKAAGRLSGNARKSMAYNDLGRVHWKLGEPEKAANAFQEACNLSETITGAQLNLAIAQFHAGNIEGARLSVNTYLGEVPTSQPALALQAMIAAKKRDWAKTTGLMTDVANANPTDAAVQNALAVSELNQGKSTTQVANRLKQVLASHPDYAPALFNLAALNDQWLRDSTTAIGYYEAYLKQTGSAGPKASAATTAIARLKNPNSAAGGSDIVQYMREGARLLENKQYADAVAQFQRAIVADPDQKNAYYNMGLAYYSMGRYTDAARASSNALGLDSQFSDARHLLALSYIQQKKWDDAEREARELSAINSRLGTELLNHIRSNRN